jgi:hypothetical protein
MPKGGSGSAQKRRERREGMEEKKKKSARRSPSSDSARSEEQEWLVNDWDLGSPSVTEEVKRRSRSGRDASATSLRGGDAEQDDLGVSSPDPLCGISASGEARCTEPELGRCSSLRCLFKARESECWIMGDWWTLSAGSYRPPTGRCYQLL